MEREILFRGKRVDNQEWLESGSINQTYYNVVYLANNTHWEEIIPETVGQYTGLTDKNGKKIFEGDVVRCIGGEYFQGYHEINKTIVIKDVTDVNCIYLAEVESVEVIGNIHDDPELLEGEENA